MRAVAVAALAACVLLVSSGCGNSGAATSPLGLDAAALVPRTAVAFVTADSNLDSTGWQTLTKVIGPLGVDRNKRLPSDLPAAVGDVLNLAVLGYDNGKPEAVAIVKPQDEAKLRSLAASFDEGDGRHYTVEHVGDWSVVADSPSAFGAVRAAAAGASLADDSQFKAAMSKLEGNALANAYVRGDAVRRPPANLRRLAGSPEWAAARLDADEGSAHVQLVAGGANPPAAYKPTLLRDAPSGAILAVSFKDAAALTASVPGVPFLRALHGIKGEGVLYIVPGAILPVVTLELRPADPVAATKAMRAVAAKIGNTLPLSVERRGAKVLLTTAEPGLNEGGKSLVDDGAFKDAVKAADVPGEVTWLAYADVKRLAPFIQAYSSLFGAAGKTPSRLEHLDTLVAFGASSGSTSTFELRLTVD
jgi:hypothetical protein